MHGFASVPSTSTPPPLTFNLRGIGCLSQYHGNHLQQKSLWRPVHSHVLSMHRNSCLILGEAALLTASNAAGPLPSMLASVAEKLPKLNRTKAKGPLFQAIEKGVANLNIQKTKPRTHAYKRPGWLNCSSSCFCIT